MMNQPKGAGRAGGTILQAFLILFAITNFLTLILTAATAGKYKGEQLGFFRTLASETHPETHFDSFPSPDDPHPVAFTLPDDPHLVLVSVLGRFTNDTAQPYVFLAVLAGITWVITSITILFLFTKIRYFNHRAARYVFRVIGVATSVLLVVFYLTWAHSYNFMFPFIWDWPLGKGAAIMAHINLLLGIFITLLAAALDTPKDWDAPTGPNSRRTSQM